MHDLNLSDLQRRTLGNALTLLAVVFVLCVVGVVVYWLGRFLNHFASVFMPIAVAGIAALVLNPYYEWMYVRVGRRSLSAVLLVYVSLLTPLIAFLWFFGSILLEQIAGVIQHGMTLSEVGLARAVELWPEWFAELQERGVWEHLREVTAERADLLPDIFIGMLKVVLAIGQGVFGFVAGLLSWVIFPVYLGFFLVLRGFKPDQLEAGLPFVRPTLRRDIIYLAVEFVNILVSFFRGQLIVAFLQGLLYAIGFSAIGLRYGFLLGLVLGFMNIIPYLGSLVGLAVMIPLGFLQEGGGWMLALGAVIVFTVVQTIESYLLTPRIMGNRTGLHPMVIIIAIFFWGTAFGGIWGMILAIPLTAFGVVFWRLLKEKYIKEIL